MSEKSKPFATIYIRKPRLSRLASLILILLVVLTVAVAVVQERVVWQAQLEDSAGRLQVLAAELERAQDKLNLNAPAWQLREPVGYYVGYSGFVTNHPETTLVYCKLDVIDPQRDEYSGAGGLYFLTVEKHLLSEVVQTDDYRLVGRDKDSAEWDNDHYSDDYYMAEIVLDQAPFVWSETKDWEDNFEQWQKHLRESCA